MDFLCAFKMVNISYSQNSGFLTIASPYTRIYFRW
jgi:hypothetical protein